MYSELNKQGGGRFGGAPAGKINSNRTGTPAGLLNLNVHLEEQHNLFGKQHAPIGFRMAETGMHAVVPLIWP